MLNQEILAYFGDNPVYTFDGSVQELKELQESTANSYGYMIVAGVIYVRAENPIVDSRAALVQGV